MFPSILLYLSTLTPHFPPIVYMTNGNAFQPGLEFEVGSTAMRFQSEYGEYLIIRFTQIDFGRTFAPKEKPKPPKEPTRPIRDIPWDHPAFCNKQVVFQDIEINNRSLEEWSLKRARTSTPDLEPQPQQPDKEKKVPETAAGGVSPKKD